jgi:hypothetical protein
MRFWNCSGLIAVTARKQWWNADGLIPASLASWGTGAGSA